MTHLFDTKSGLMNKNVIGLIGLILCFILSFTVFVNQEIAAQVPDRSIFDDYDDNILDYWDFKNHRATVLDANGNRVTNHGGGVHPDDSLALIALYHSTQGDYWRDNAGWFVDPVDFWIGVARVENVGTELEPEWRVTRINMPSWNHSIRPGSIPPEIGNMAYLQQFVWNISLLTGGLEYLTNPDLRLINIFTHIMSGEIPWDIYSELNNLEALHIRNSPQYSHKSLIVGEIPPIIGEFTNLQILYLMDQQLSGNLPEELANLENLVTLNLSWNNFTGTWPDLGHLTNLRAFEVWDNPFEPGPIPAWIQNLDENLRSLDIWNTNRTGEVPVWLTNMFELRRLGIGEGMWRGEAAEHTQYQPENMLGGVIPDLSMLANLNAPRFYGPGFTGPVPDWIGNIPSLNRLYLIGTGFEGPLPGNIFLHDNLQRIYIMNNPNLTGGLPPEMGTTLTLERILIGDNTGMTVGDFPEWIGNLVAARELNLRNMGITGTIPASLENLSASINILKLNDNPGLTGPLPAWMETVDWNRFDISRTGLDVTSIPDWLQNAGNMVRLGLAGLDLEGTIPEWMGDLSFLAHLSLNDNNLTGSIPGSLGNLMFVDSLSLANNQLSGPLPETFADIGRLTNDRIIIRTLDISGNADLVGPVPSALVDASQMRDFRFDGTGLCEPADPAFHNWLENIIPANSDVSYPPIPSNVSRTNVSCDPVSIEGTEDVANRFYLHHNYPNPFNPATTIRYEIPSDTHVQLRIYNVLGQQVASLVNETQRAGQYEVNFDATGLSSGTYLYRLDSGNRSLTQTMMLLK